MLVAGAGVELNFAQHGTSRLSTPGQAVSFDGAWQTSCTLLDGSSTDLNLIVSAERAQSASRAMALTGGAGHSNSRLDRSVCVLSVGNPAIDQHSGEVATLRAVDVARCAPSDGEIRCTRRDRDPECVCRRGQAAKRLTRAQPRKGALEDSIFHGFGQMIIKARIARAQSIIGSAISRHGNQPDVT